MIVTARMSKSFDAPVLDDARFTLEEGLVIWPFDMFLDYQETGSLGIFFFVMALITAPLVIYSFWVKPWRSNTRKATR